MLGKEALLLMQGKKRPVLSIPNGWGGGLADMLFLDGTSLSLDEFGSRFPDRKVPISLLEYRAIFESGVWGDTSEPFLVNVRTANSGLASRSYYIIDPTKDAEIRW
nr:MAG TPA: hypothetical protein [Caudoviricetes sp.]